MALLQAARGAISAGTSGDEAAKSFPSSSFASPPLSPPVSSLLTSGPGSPVFRGGGGGGGLMAQQRPGRIARFPHRKGSIREEGAPHTSGGAGGGGMLHQWSDDEEGLEDERGETGRHQSAPLRPTPAVYVPYQQYIESQPHSLSCTSLEQDTTLRLMAAQAQHQQSGAAQSPSQHGATSSSVTSPHHQPQPDHAAVSSLPVDDSGDPAPDGAPLSTAAPSSDLPSQPFDLNTYDSDEDDSDRNEPDEPVVEAMEDGLLDI